MNRYMDRSASIYIEHILQSIELLEDYISGVDDRDFSSSVRVQDLVCRRLEIIGEAVKNIPSDFKNKYPEVKWKNIAGLRDVLIHHYFGVDLLLLWNVVKNDIPELKKQIHDILTREDLGRNP
ncbi:MAG: DUF86 domain-containing protein [Spirochaetota bacterium]